MRAARQLVRPERLLILVLHMRTATYEAFREEVARRLGFVLPALPGTWHGGHAGFLRFAPDWTPEFLPLRAPLLRRG